ncbi:MAG TPA: MBL fold metallo-hydrolase [Chitinispirillaceae bacterium]|nr:MBL fold metallo-hydrolase [Chitinispirillaceae bacterium]
MDCFFKKNSIGSFVRCKVLRSGSSGNCTLIEHQNQRILIDAGFSQRRILEILDESGISISSVSAVLVTHCHADHLNYSTLQVCRKNSIPLWINEANQATLRSLYKESLIERCAINYFTADQFTVGTFQVQPFELSHDAAGTTCGFVIKAVSSSGSMLTYAADLGIFPDMLIQYFKNSKVIILEANHDLELLWNNPLRPYIHKKRVTGDFGHLSNMQSADALIRICKSSSVAPEKVILCHLSEDHNTPELARTTIKEILAREGVTMDLMVAERKCATPFVEL